MNAFARQSGRGAEQAHGRQPAEEKVAPIVAAVDGSEASRAAIEESVRLAGELDAPIAFVFVRRGPAGYLGEPAYQGRLTKEMAAAERALGEALTAAADAGVSANGEVLEGSPRRRISEFARAREARLVVVGSRHNRLRRSVSKGVIRDAGRPVIVARSLPELTATA
jgi:nucleotide-binding universal stress UspA family protein